MKKHEQLHTMFPEYEQRSHQTRIVHPTIVFTIMRAWAETEDISVDGNQR